MIALNLFTSSILGQVGLSRIKIPVAIGAGTADTVTPACCEPIQAFTWLTTPEKYLEVGDKGTHTDLIAGVSTVILHSSNRFFSFSEPDSLLGHLLLQAFSTAFMKVYLAHQTDYRVFLRADYIKKLDLNELSKVYFVSSLPAVFLKN